MGSVLFVMIAAFFVMLLVFVFWKRSAIFSGGIRGKAPVPAPKQRQDITMQKMISVLLPAEQQPAAKELLSDYSELTWKNFERKYFSVLKDTGYEEEDFCSDIRSSLLMLWMQEHRLAFLWEDAEQTREAKSFLETQSGVGLSEPKGEKTRQIQRWTKELQKEGWSVLLLRDLYEGVNFMVLPKEKAVQLIGKKVSNLQVCGISYPERD